ncbi:unnamed protein product [Linum trigynum]|uniref:Uncharacterized protein n=1 Tax=Linum trigynum TaxID=586398 RepID=A0AAV2G8Q5_9ROSI
MCSVCSVNFFILLIASHSYSTFFVQWLLFSVIDSCRFMVSFLLMEISFRGPCLLAYALICTLCYHLFNNLPLPMW